MGWRKWADEGKFMIRSVLVFLKGLDCDSNPVSVPSFVLSYCLLWVVCLKKNRTQHQTQTTLGCLFALFAGFAAGFFLQSLVTSENIILLCGKVSMWCPCDLFRCYSDHCRAISIIIIWGWHFVDARKQRRRFQTYEETQTGQDCLIFGWFIWNPSNQEPVIAKYPGRVWTTRRWQMERMFRCSCVWVWEERHVW